MTTPADLIGRRILDVRPMTAHELDLQGWDLGRFDPVPVVIVVQGEHEHAPLHLFPSRDAEGNGPGIIFGHDIGSGDSFLLAGRP